MTDPAWRTVRFAVEVSAQITEGTFYDLAAPVPRVCSVEVPVLHPTHLENAAVPQPDTTV
ncbi:MAG: hypothetical protein NNA20_09625 [Nitrospira sp.]|nr:hypothetical protein [Nitrospira sp.]